MINDIINDANGLRITFDNNNIHQLIWIVYNGQYALSIDGITPVSDEYVDTILAQIANHDPTIKLLSNLNGYNAAKLGFNNNNIVWNDLRVPLTSVQAVGVNAPTFAFFRNDGGPASGKAATFGFDQETSSIPYDAKQDLPNSFAVSVWVKPELGGGLGSLARFIMERADHFSIFTDDDLFVDFSVDGVTSIRSSDDVLTADSWNHIVCSCNVDGGNTNLEIWVNNILVADGSSSSTPTTSDNAIVVGTRSSSNRYLDGDLDELAIFSANLTTTDISDLYAAGAGKVLEGDESNLVGLYHFDDDALDYSDGTNVNMNYINPVYVEDSAVGGTGSVGTRLYGFQHNQTEEVFFTLQLDHGVAQGSKLYPHVHWLTKEDTNNKVKWGLEYTIAPVTGNFETTKTITNNAPMSSIKAYKHNITELGTIDTTSGNTSTMIHGRVFRDGTDSDDTFTGIAYLQEIDFHAQFDIFGTPNQFSR